MICSRSFNRIMHFHWTPGRRVNGRRSMQTDYCNQKTAAWTVFGRVGVFELKYSHTAALKVPCKAGMLESLLIYTVLFKSERTR